MAHNRGSSNDSIGDDCFHDLGCASSVIGDWIEYLRRGIRAEDVVSAEMLDIIEKEMLLVAPHMRIPSEALVRRVDGTLRTCEDTINRLPRYSFPKRLEPAFDREQKDAAKVWENPRSRAPSTKPMLDRSVRFAQPRGPLVNAVQQHRQPAADPRTPGPGLHLGIDSLYHIGVEPSSYGHNRPGTQGVPRNQYAAPLQYPHAAQSAQWAPATQPVSQLPPNRSPARTPTHDSVSSVPPSREDEQPKFDYYAALDLLIRNRGWIYNSILEHPDSRLRPPVPNNPGSSGDVRPSGQTNQGGGGRANTWSTLIRSNSTVKKGERNSGYTSALAQAFHKFKPSSRSSRVSSVNPRTGPSTNSRPGTAPVQSMKADTTFGALFDDRDIVSRVEYLGQESHG